MKLSLVTLGLGLAHLLGLAAAACPSVTIRTRNRIAVGKNTTLAVKVSNKGGVTDGVLTVRAWMVFDRLSHLLVSPLPTSYPPDFTKHARRLPSMSIALFYFHPPGHAPTRVCVRRGDEARWPAALRVGRHPYVE
jgi:hypothetical protein